MHTQLMQIQITDTGTDIDTHTDTDVAKFKLLGCFAGIIDFEVCACCLAGFDVSLQNVVCVLKALIHIQF